ncbi:MAG: endonuclease/exonuclease/phosphatase family protein, partial [Bacteroidetes bacterium]|nr:endonuclease/exonuclease/phosphatase family protein [Bacteroidota bacterium]
MLCKLLKSIVVSLLISVVCLSQQHTIMTYNLLNYPGSTGAIRNPYFITVLSNTEPDIIVTQELLSQGAVNEFVSNVLMQVSTDYDAGLFVDGNDTDNAIFFKTSLFTFIANNPIHTALRDINEFVLMHKATGDTIRIYSLHLKASQGSDNEQKRAAEIDSLRKVTDALHPASHFIVTGDFNIYRSTEPAYQILLNQTNSGYVLDPIDTPGDWHNNFSFASIHTQSPRTRQFQGGANGGMDDRFDMILISQSISDGDGISYVSDSYTAYGQDGNHFNDSINAPPNTAVGQEIADAIHYASDHIPLFATFQFDDLIPVELLSFTASVSRNSVTLNWTTATELNNLGFEIQRLSIEDVWEKIVFVDGYGTTTEIHKYSYVDANLTPAKYLYRLKQIDFDGQYEYSDAIEVEVNRTLTFAL